MEVLTAVVQAVHAVGGRMAADCQTADGSRNAVLAGVDSLEHGMHLDPGLIDQMAAQGTAFVLPNVRAACEAGGTVLAGTDSFPRGTVDSEVEWLVRSGLPAEAALGAASWVACSWLRLPGLVEGGLADLVAYDADPTVHAEEQ